MQSTFKQIFFLLSFFTLKLNAQDRIEIIALQPYKTQDSISFNKQSQTEYTAIVLASREAFETGKFISIGGYRYEISMDEHFVENDSLFFSNPIILPKSRAAVSIDNINLYDFLYFINGSSDVTIIINPSAEGCERPSSVSQAEWRSGLTAPSYQRFFHQVNHMIVHHSAGSNTNTNYTEVVRSIYLFHTEVRGWSDIGYNYLIAQDGTTYDGRDPGNGEQSDVMGAHFCGRNSGSMGICLLGNYENVEPREEMLASLTILLAWKADFDDIDVMASRPHPLNAQLSVLAGHQDGCATLCPGKNVYDKLADIRIQTVEQIELCNQEDEDMISDLYVFPNPSSGQNINIKAGEQFGRLKAVHLIDLNGKIISLSNFFEIEENSYSLQIGHYAAAMYVLDLSFEKAHTQRKIIIRH